jgi:hypothetical protein
MWWLFRTYFPEKYLHFIGLPDRWELSDGDRAALDDIVPWLFPIHDRAAGVIFDAFASDRASTGPSPRR